MKEQEFKGIIIKGIGGLYGVRPISNEDIKVGEDGTVPCRARGVFRHDKITPLPGDLVICEITGDEGEGVINEIEERKNSLIRPALANLTHLFVVIPATKPKPDLLTADKLISAAEDKEIEPVIVITKEDLDENETERIAAIYRTGGFSVFTLSGYTGEGVDELLSYMEKEAKNCLTAAFAGVSGAGKSTLMAKLFPSLSSLKTGEVSRKIQRGKHTTRHAELYPVKVGEGICFIADTPGFSMIDFARFNFTDKEGLPYTFREFAPLMGECRYTKCTHTKEEGCAILEKVKDGDIAKGRHESYIAMLEEINKNPPWKKK